MNRLMATFAAALLASLSLVACDGEDGGRRVPVDCSVTGMNSFVIAVMKDDYLYHDRMPDLGPGAADSPEAMMEALRVPPDRFSRVALAAEDQAFFGEGRFVGVGVGTGFVGARLFVREVFDGPAAAAGIVRGDELLEINGRSIAQIVASGDSISEAFASDQLGATVTLRIREADGDERDLELVAAVVSIEPVPLRSIIDLGGTRVGYLVFKTFITPSYQALDEAFAWFDSQGGVDELVLDLRYNGGGLLDVARQLAQQVGGDHTAGQVFYRLVHSAKDSGRNSTVRFGSASAEQSLDRLVVITSAATASASELIINGLSPYIDVVTVGATTTGKPVGSRGIPFCDRVAHPIQFEIQNVLGQADYFDGLPPNCPAQDELGEPLGSTDEDSLQTALSYLQDGSCPVSSRYAARRQEPPLLPPTEDGFRALLGEVY